MNVVTYRQGGCIYLCEFRNDNDKISQILNDSSRNQELDAAWDRMCRDDIYDVSFLDEDVDKLWNDRMVLVLEVLEENGCTILWDDV
jgi:hypothetical protein